MVRPIAIGLGALVAGFALVFFGETLGHMFFPLPGDINPYSIESLAAHMDRIPIGALLSVAVAHFAGALLLVYIARKYSDNVYVFYIPIAVFVCATLLNLIMLPHPIWFMVVDLAALVGAIWVGMYLTEKPKPAYLHCP